MILMETTKKKNSLNSIPFKTAAQLFSGMDCLDSKIHSLSLRSAVLSHPLKYKVKINDIYRLNIPIKNARAIAMSVRVISINENYFEVEWTQIDMESFAILKRTIELNSSNKNQVRDDIKNLVNNED